MNAYGAEVMPTPERSVNRAMPDDASFAKDTEFQKRFREMARGEDQARATLREAGAAAVAKEEKSSETIPTGASPVSEMPPVEASALPLPRIAPARRQPSPTLGRPAPATPALSFAVSRTALDEDETTVLPAGSFVKARVVSGVEANTLEPYPVLLQLDYAFTGPNHTKVDLSNCFMIAKARANLSTERVIMETDTLSCVREDGEHFKASARGYTAGADSTFGSTGTFISKQGTVLLAAVLASIAKNAGEAIATAQTTTSVAAGASGAAQTATNVTGDQARFVAGRSVVDGASLIAQWYLDYAKQLIPSIGIGSGEEVHVVMLETIRVPLLQESSI